MNVLGFFLLLIVIKIIYYLSSLKLFWILQSHRNPFNLLLRGVLFLVKSFSFLHTEEKTSALKDLCQNNPSHPPPVFVREFSFLALPR